MLTRLRTLPAAFLLALSAVFATGSAEAAKVYAPDGVGAGGYDPVAYFTDGAATPGSDQFTAEHEGVTYKFASAEHRDLFAAGVAAPRRPSSAHAAPQGRHERVRNLGL